MDNDINGERGGGGGGAVPSRDGGVEIRHRLGPMLHFTTTTHHQSVSPVPLK